MAEIVDLYDIHGNKLNKQVQRGETLPEGEYYLVVTAVIKNHNGDLLISTRAGTKKGAGQLETVGGLVTAGEDSLQGIQREVFEELGLNLPLEAFQFKTRYTFETERRYHFDVWLVNCEVDLAQLTLQVEEVKAAQWLSPETFYSALDAGLCFNTPIYNRMKSEGIL